MLRVTISQLSIVLILFILLCSELAKASKIQKDFRLSEFENTKRSSEKASRCICGFVSFKCCKKKRSSVIEVSWRLQTISLLNDIRKVVL